MGIEAAYLRPSSKLSTSHSMHRLLGNWADWKVQRLSHLLAMEG